MFNDYRIGGHVLKRLTILSFILMLLLFQIVVINQTAVSQQHNTPSTNMLYVGGTGNENYSTIQEAINHAASGDLIFVYNGTYYENVLINKTIALIGEERNTTIIDANDNGGVMTIHANNVSINHFTIQNAGYHANGIYVNSNGNHVTNTTIFNNRNVGIWINDNSHSNTISHSYFSGNSYGLLTLTACSNNTINNNVFTNNNHGLKIEESSDTTLYNNKLYDNSNNQAYIYRSSNITISNNHFEDDQHSGLHLYNIMNCTISNNTFLANGIWIYGENKTTWNSHSIQNNTINNKPLYYIKNCFEPITIPTHIGQVIAANCENLIIQNLIITNGTNGISLGFSHNNTIRNNYITNVGTALIFEGSYNNTIYQNELIDNGRAIFTFFSSYNTIYQNNIKENTYGITISDLIWMDPPENNYIYHNNFVNNSESQAFDSSSNYWDNNYPNGGNYWDDYTGIDAVGDGIGDTPYNISGDNNQDLYPFIEKNGWLKTNDIDQEVFGRGFPIRHTWDGDWGSAQNFTPLLDSLTRVDIYIRKFGIPEFDLTIELREDTVEGALIASLSIPPDEFDTNWNWIIFDIEDIETTPGTDYFIVCPPAPSGVSTSFGYEWGYAFGNQYDEGSFWFTRDGGNLWRALPTRYDFVFRTYGYA